MLEPLCVSAVPLAQRRGSVYHPQAAVSIAVCNRARVCGANNDRGDGQDEEEEEQEEAKAAASGMCIMVNLARSVSEQCTLPAGAIAHGLSDCDGVMVALSSSAAHA